VGARRQLKSYMATKLIVTIPDLKAPLLLYVAASDHAISGVLAMRKKRGRRSFSDPFTLSLRHY
jgi:hypothetical protein